MSRAPISVAVVEDVPLFRRLLEDIVAADARFAVVASAATGRQARTVVPPSGATVLLLDLHLPDEPGLLLGLDLRRAMPELRVVVLSEHARPEVLGSLDPDEIPYWSYLLKGSISSPEHLLSTLAATVVRPIVDEHVRQQGRPTQRLDLLTDRQREILSLVAGGMSNAAIAEKLHLTSKAVEYHLTQVYAQLDLLDDKDRNARVRASVLFASTRSTPPRA